MTVESYLELFTTLFGWQQYNNLWSVLSDTGIVFLPFLFILAKNFVGPATSMEAKDASATSVRRMEIDIALALTVVVLAAQPFITLSPGVLTYEKPCGAGTAVTPGASGTTYDSTFASILTTTNVPIWWYGMMALSAGATHAAVNGIGCVADLSGYRLDIDKTRIQDPTLLAELGQFVQDCFIPSRSKYYREKPNVAALLATFGARDPEWFGSNVYRQTPGYYDQYRASTPVTGWPYAPARDTEYETPPANGRPFCKEWYEDPTIGLRQKLLDQVPPTLRSQALNILATVGFGTYTATDMENDTIKSVVTSTLAAAPANSDFSTTYNDEGLFKASLLPVNLPLVGAGLGTAWEQLSFSPMMYAVRSGAPIIQSLILLAIYMLLPLALVFSSYSWSMVITGSIAIFTVKFWSYLWHAAKWLEDNLARALYPDGASYFSASLANLTDGDFALKVMLIEMATALLFIGLPVVFSMIVAWGGHRAIMAISSAVGLFQSPIQRAGGAAANVGKGIAASRINRAI
jgi:TraG-like protein, N-terminal region